LERTALDIPTLDDIRAAAERIRPYVHRTPVLRCAGLERLCGCSLFLKAENLQKVGAFKARGAHNAVFSLEPAAAARGVATHSSGNHAAALALAAANRGIAAHIVMPAGAPAVKRAAVAGYGARITECASSLQDRERTLERVVAATGAAFIHPYDDPRVIAGQGTAALELLAETGPLDLLLAPVGGGGLMSGSAIAAAGLSPATRLIGAEPAGADDAARSLASSRLQPSLEPRTAADGLLTSLSRRTFRILSKHLERIATVSEAAIAAAMRHVFERAKLVIEPSAAVPIAALLEHDLGHRGRRVGVILSGGNADLDRLPWQQQFA
jgi:threonine dehydratase